MSKTSKLQHYHLVAGTAAFVSENGDIEHTNINTTLAGDERYVTAKQVGLAQQGIQMRLFERTGGPVDVRDVFIVGISYLGHMTPEKFMHGIEELQQNAA